MRLLTIRYPSTLPRPQVSNIAPVERRQLSSAERPRDARALQRDRLQRERVNFPAFNAEQFAAFRDWWRNDLVYGASWFVADWPTPSGATTTVRRFVSAPSWTFISKGWFKISAECEIRGAGVDPVRAPTTIALLHLDGNLLDEVGGGFQNIPDGLLSLPFTASTTGFGQQGLFSYSLGGVGQSGINRVYAGADPLINTPEWQIDAFLTLTAGSFAARSLVTISRDTVDPDVQTTLVSLQVSSGGTDLRTLIRRVGLGIAEVPAVFSGARDLVDGQRTHVRLTYRNGEVLQFHNAVLVARMTGVVVDTAVASTTQTRISIGCTPSGGSGGITAFGARMAGRIDEFRLASEVTDDSDFEVPNRPFTLPLEA